VSVKSGFLMPVSPSDDAVDNEAAESEEEDEVQDRKRSRGREENEEEDFEVVNKWEEQVRKEQADRKGKEDNIEM